MTKSAKTYLIVGGFILFGILYWWMDSNSNSSGSRVVVSQSPLASMAKTETVHVSELSKEEVYLKEDKENTDAKKFAEQTMEQKDPSKLTSTFDGVYESSYDKELKEAKSKTLTPSYSKSKDVESQGHTENGKVGAPKKEPPPILKSSVPVNRKVEIQKADGNLTQGEELFNTSTYTNSTSGNQDVGLSESSTIKAAVFGNHDVKAGGLVRFRLLEQAVFSGTTFPRNTVFFGKCSFGQDRLYVVVDRLPLKSGYLPINLEIHDQDLQEGIFAPIKVANEAAADETLEGVEEILSSTGSVAGQAGSGVARIFRSTTNGTQKVAIADAYPVLFVLTEK